MRTFRYGTTTVDTLTSTWSYQLIIFYANFPFILSIGWVFFRNSPFNSTAIQDFSKFSSSGRARSRWNKFTTLIRVLSLGIILKGRQNWDVGRNFGTCVSFRTHSISEVRFFREINYDAGVFYDKIWFHSHKDKRLG